MSEGNHENTKKQSIPSIQRNSMQGINLFIKFLVIMETHKKNYSLDHASFSFIMTFNVLKMYVSHFKVLSKI